MTGAAQHGLVCASDNGVYKGFDLEMFLACATGALEQVAEWSGSRVEELDRHSSLTSALHSVKLT
jgi:hypothetical protein